MTEEPAGSWVQGRPSQAGSAILAPRSTKQLSESFRIVVGRGQGKTMEPNGLGTPVGLEG